jgi:hypothetical protein
MVIFTYVSYPTEKAKDVVERFFNAPQIPDFMSRKGPFVSANLSDGIFAASLFELDKSRLAEGLEFLGSYFATFFGVPGYKYEIKPFFNVEEALKMIGMG